AIDSAGRITWTPSPAQVPSTNVLETVVTDNGQPALSATNRFTVVVGPLHMGPWLPIQTNRTVLELTQLTITNTAGDADLPPRTLTYRLIEPPAGAAIDSNGVISWRPSESQGPTTNTLTTVVLDDASPPKGATNSFTVLVQEVNQPPVLLAQADRRTAGLEQLVVTNKATDSDLPANALSYRLLVGPAGAAIDANGVITWSPAVPQVPGTNLIVTVATDANPWAANEPHLSVTNSFTVVVDPVHVGPDLPHPADVTINELTSLVVTNTAYDADVPYRTLSYLLMNPPAGASIDANGVITWKPSELQGPSTNVLTTVVTDDGVPVLGDVNSFVVVVQEVNTAPALPVQTNRTLAGLERLVVTNTGSDADLPINSLTYQLVQAPAGASIDTNGIITWKPIVAQVPGTYVFTTVLSDFNPQAVANQRLSVTNSFMVVVNAIYNGPKLPVLSEATLNELSLLTVTNTATVTDVPAFPLTYTLIDPPAGVTIDTNNGVITWTPTELQGPSTNVLITVVT
ncbi:MAG TPA: hypothetical protein VNT26_15665, partial [Candidatus Sulfotelmatobacter sp.]|nr:hypothetical protein [Candidatus Sulfotelmatobacter sp.]